MKNFSNAETTTAAMTTKSNDDDYSLENIFSSIYVQYLQQTSAFALSFSSK